MLRIKVHKNIERMFEFLYRIGLWNRTEEETAGEKKLKLFYFVYYSLFPISLIAGAVTSDNQDENIVMVGAAITTTVLLMKLWYLIWRRNEIFELINRICDYHVDDRETLIVVNDKLKILMKFVTIFVIVTISCATCIGLISPSIGERGKLFFSIAFPLDYGNNEFAYWIAFVFIFTEMAITACSSIFSVIVWYVMASCSWRYEVLGNQILKMGSIRTVIVIDDPADEYEISDIERDNLYLRDLVRTIELRNELKELTDQLDSFTSKIFAAQLTTSAACICVSTYSIAFIRGDNYVEVLIYFIAFLYSIFDIFMVTFFGNEMSLAIDRLSHRLFESDWVDRSQYIKKNVIIFGEFLMQPHQLMVLKIYPLTLVTFTRILNSAYSMFNILKNFK